MPKNVLLVAFQGELMCFTHVLLHAIDLNEKGYTVRIIIEGAATKLLPELAQPDKPFAELYQKAKDAGLFECVCKACAAKMGTLPEAQAQGLAVKGEVLGHPGLSEFIDGGYQVITF